MDPRTGSGDCYRKAEGKGGTVGKGVSFPEL